MISKAELDSYVKYMDYKKNIQGDEVLWSTVMDVKDLQRRWQILSDIQEHIRNYVYMQTDIYKLFF